MQNHCKQDIDQQWAVNTSSVGTINDAGSVFNTAFLVQCRVMQETCCVQELSR